MIGNCDHAQADQNDGTEHRNAHRLIHIWPSSREPPPNILKSQAEVVNPDP